ncbi:hypothetical protein [uncultured Clostridium sp.]|uniref:hypothetical protein n=1 Tax=uncultured Clostridium sp. TaxID=59620 RepID=UPI00262677B8|nr:hypothetical protein [uncultured Clostridium sp.]
MNNPTIVVAHKINNRIRFKLSHPIKNSLAVMDELCKKDGIRCSKYNDVTKSIIVEYNSFRIAESEIIMRVITMYSKNYDLVPVRLVYNSKKRNMPPMAYYSLLTLVIGGISKYIPMNIKVTEFINWAIVGTTIGAIGEHAYNEINEKGYFDPEVVSVMYLINSVRKGNYLLPSAITWGATFGRHILEMSYARTLISVKEFKNKCSDEVYYDVSVMPDTETSKSANIVRVFLEKFIETESNDIGKSFVLSGKGVTKHEGSLFSGFDNGPSFISMDDKNNQLYKNIIN